MTDKRVNVLVMDSSIAARQLLCEILGFDPEISVQGAVKDGKAALDFLKKHEIDVMLMDINSPSPDGFAAARRIMEMRPVPIVLCSNAEKYQGVVAAFEVMNAGALACVEKPADREQRDFERLGAKIRETVKLMSEVRVVKHWVRNAKRADSMTTMDLSTDLKSRECAISIIGIGASTGGPPALQSILAGLPKNFPVPILIVQHISPGFLPGLAEWLAQTSGLPVHIAAHGDVPIPGHVYLAPDNFHMGLNSSGAIQLSNAAPEGGMRPAVSYLFRALAGARNGSAIGVLLTGMGRDGAAELKLMRDNGAVTIAQDLESSVVHGMPGEAIALGGATHVLAASKIAAALLSTVTRRNSK